MSFPRPENREGGLHQSLSRAQIVMIGLGGTIGTGLFAGSTIAIGYAGPAVILSYAIAAFAAAVLVLSLSEMAVMHPSAGSFGIYAETYLNRWSGFIVRYTYWIAEIVAVGGEAVAAGLYMTYWFPTIPVWIWSVGFAFIVVYINSRSVKHFGTIEYWLAFIKVTAIVIFIILGAGSILGVGTPAIGLHNLTGLPGGFMPMGFGGVWMAVIVGIFSFLGIEVVAVTSGETQDPQTAIPAALRTMAIRLFLFYVVALAVTVAFAPWTETGSKIVMQSPFVRVLANTGIGHAAGIMNFVVLSAALSSMNTNVYLASRMVFSLARAGFAPGLLGRLSSRGTPTAAIALSGACTLLVAGLSKLTPLAFNYLIGIALFGSISVWLIILASHLSFRRHHRAETLPLRMPLFPYMQIAGMVLLVAVLITMAFDELYSISWKVGIPWLLLLSVVYAVWHRRIGHRVERQAALSDDNRANLV